MDEQQMEQYFEQHAVDGELPQEEMVKLLTGAADTDAASAGDNDGGDAPDPEEAAKNEAPPEEEAKEAEPEEATEPEAEPVLVAKDGKNTIPFSELVEAREAAKAARASNEELSAQVQTLKDELAVLKGMGVGANANPPKEAEEAKASPENEAVAKLREDWPEVAAAVDGIVGGQRERIRSLEEQLARMQPTTEQLAAERMQQEHYGRIAAAHPDAQDIVTSKAFADWQAAQPGFMRQIFEHVINQGTTEQVIELLDGFKQANPTWGKSPAGQDAAASDNAAQDAARREAVRQAKERATSSAPKSLSDIPGGAAVETDATEAIMQMGPGARLDKMLGMTPDKIEEMLRRAV